MPQEANIINDSIRRNSLCTSNCIFKNIVELTKYVINWRWNTQLIMIAIAEYSIIQSLLVLKLLLVFKVFSCATK